MEARNLRNMSMVQTPLLGDENTPLHVGPSGGTGFESATPRHHVAFTPNPLATPLHGDPSDNLSTPRTVSGISSTPLRTPMRDSLSINPEGFTPVGSTPRDQYLRMSSAKRALKAGFMSLPRPENNFELLVPEDEGESQTTDASLSEEDAAERDARLQRVREVEERAALARRSQVVQFGLPRPPNVDMEALLRKLNIDEPESDLQAAQQLIDFELAQLLQHDSIAHPIPGTSRPGATVSNYEIPDDDDVVAAKSAIHLELASAVGFPNANPNQLREGLLALSKAETVDETASWATVRQQLAYDAFSKTWVDPTNLSLPKRIEGYSVMLDESRDTMTKDASKATKAEKKLGVTLGGYQARSGALSKRIADAFEELQKTKVEYDSFSRLRVNESAAGPRRVSALKEEVERLESRERSLQARYAELEQERRESESRVAVLEEKMMTDAEALNEAHLAEMEGVEV
jgi:pre-mRNA-splicing factor CDC5/CEF1